MYKSFVKIGMRYLWRKRTYSVLNYACLTFGLICAIITALYIRNILSYDKFHKNYNRLYSVDAYVTYFNGARFPKEYLSASLADVLKEKAPEIEDLTRIAERDLTFISGDKSFSGKGYYADSNFFTVFTFPLLRKGDQKASDDPNSVVISESMAIRFFNSTDCIGKTLILKESGNREAYTVAGIFKEIPSQSKMQFDYIIPFTKFLDENKWALETGSTACQTWALLNNSAGSKFIESKIKNLIRSQESTLNQELFLFPLKEQVLYSYAGGKRVWKEMQTVVIIGAIGFAILLIACFNYINLAIALNFRRYREAGIRKVSGSGKPLIVLQYLGETLIITLISLISALILVRLLLSGFNIMFNYSINLRLLDLNMIAFFISITLFTGFVSGIFPALYLASSSPVNALKGRLAASHSFSLFRQGLIVFQFVIPVVLIICMIIIRTQDSYIRNFNAGVDKDKLIILENSVNTKRHSESLKAELLAIPGIDAVSFTNCIPTRGTRVSSEVTWEGKDLMEKLHFWCINSDFDYDKAVRVMMVKGRYFNPLYSTDSAAYVINDIAAIVMKKKDPVGSVITLDGQKGTIIGVFKDFHALDLAGPFVPVILQIKSDDRPTILIKYSKGAYPELINKIRSVYQHYENEIPFHATLFRDLVPYSNLSLPSNLVGLSFIIALLLACMGLFGLASFTSENRTKEIGIRKANGARTASIMSLLLKGYIKWLLIAFVIALPIATIIGKIFLGRFNFHATMPLWAFLEGPLIVSAVAILTVSTLTWHAASQNPVKALRYE
jgi:putative ABC transport system permease protein